MIKLGSHVPFKAPNYLVDAIEYSLKNGANCAMIYLGAPQNTKRIAVDKMQFAAYQKKYANVIAPHDIVVHAPYIINLANAEKHPFSQEFLIAEIERMAQLQLRYLVLHPGASTKYPLAQAMTFLAENLKQILAQTAHTNVEIILETMSGKGTEIGVTFEQLLQLIQSINSSRIGICLDTCHLWDAGYDLHQYDQFMAQLEAQDVLKYVKVIHLNDSKNPLSSHKDRHENIGQGHIGTATLKRFVHDPRFANIPIILETPIPDSGPIYDQEIAMLLDRENH